MQYKTTKRILIDQRKLESLFRLGCPDNIIIELLKTGKPQKTGDPLIDDTLESLVDYRVFENWGGKRVRSGRPKKNQLENQDENQLENQDANQVADKDIDITGGISNKGVIGGKEKRGVFVAPTLEEVLTYAKQMNDFAAAGGFTCGKQTAIDFFNQYDRQGWLLGNGIHMANWKSGLRRWADEQKRKLLDE